jgi:multidrug efflux system membrane fusion protein
LLLLPLVLLLGGGIYLYQGKKAASASKQQEKGAKGGGAQSTPVAVATARSGDMEVYLSGLGSVTPLNTVNVRSRVDGQLMEIRFREGEMVKQGELLAIIDPRPFQVQLTQAEGQMARDQELLKNARLDLQRYRQLWEQDSLPKQQLDTQEALVRQYEAAVKVDQGQIDSARLQLTYSRITAPVGGRVGLKQVDQGNIVRAADSNPLVVITQLQPITVVFPIPEDNLPRIHAGSGRGGGQKVEVFDREQKRQLAVGTLQTVDNQIDSATGTVKLKALFANRNTELFPNQFVNARLLVETLKDAVIVPSAAIQRGAQGTFVYLLKGDGTVGVRPVGIGVAQGDDIAVTSGLAPGDRVVIDGTERLRDGSKVEVKEPGKGPGTGGGKGKGRDQGAGKGPGEGAKRSN